MNIKDYILSGILEQYILGDVSPQEKQEVECLSKIYPEIKEELKSIELSLELFAQDQSTAVPENVKQNIFAEIEKDSNTTPLSFSKTENPISSSTDKPTTELSFSKRNYYKVASILLAIGFASSAVYFTSTLKSNQSAIVAANDTAKQLDADNRLLQQELALNTNQEFSKIILNGNEKVAQQSIQLFWNKKSGQLFLSQNNFPAIASNKQYQLWGLDNGKPIDLGVFDGKGKLIAMKDIKNLQTFAITIEDKGGKPTPNLAELCGMITI
jgi:hypothetical protein